MQHARVSIDPAFVVAPVDRRVFGSFVEHMGRCVYTGIFEPGHPTADEDGLRVGADGGGCGVGGLHAAEPNGRGPGHGRRGLPGTSGRVATLKP